MSNLPNIFQPNQLAQAINDHELRVAAYEQRIAQATAGSIDGEVLSARGGYPSLAARLAALDPGAGTLQKYFTTPAGGQSVFDLSSVGAYQTNAGKIIQFIAGGVPQFTGVHFTETNSTTITTVVPIPGGVDVFIHWFDGAISLLSGHSRKHRLGGGDELNIKDLAGFQAEVPDKIAAQQADTLLRTEKSGISGLRRDLLVNRNKKITTIGDSTSDNTTGALYIWSEIASYFMGSGDSLEGVAFTHRGANGNTLSNFINNVGPAGKNINDAIADQADLYILSYGINDVRLGATSQTQLTNMLDTAIQSLLKNTNGYILLRIPNSFLSDDPGATGWLTPLSSAQAYTDLIWNSYISLRGKYARVEVLDTQTLIFGRTSPLKANAPLMNDILHPGVEGYRRMGRLIANYIGVPTPIRDDLIKDAQTANPTKPYLLYPKYLESRPDLYELVAQGYFVGMGTNYIDFSFDPTAAANAVKGGYILKVGDALAYDLDANISPIAMGANTRILNMTYANYANNNKGMVKVFKPKAVAPVKSLSFWGTNMSGLQFAQYASLDAITFVSSIVANMKNPILTGVPTTFNVKVSNNTTVKTLGTLSFPHNYMGATFTWNTTDYPNSNATINSIDFIYLTCGTTTYTGEIVIKIGLG